MSFAVFLVATVVFVAIVVGFVYKVKKSIRNNEPVRRQKALLIVGVLLSSIAVPLVVLLGTTTWKRSKERSRVPKMSHDMRMVGLYMGKLQSYNPKLYSGAEKQRVNELKQEAQNLLDGVGNNHGIPFTDVQTRLDSILERLRGLG